MKERALPSPPLLPSIRGLMHPKGKEGQFGASTLDQSQQKKKVTKLIDSEDCVTSTKRSSSKFSLNLQNIRPRNCQQFVRRRSVKDSRSKQVGTVVTTDGKERKK